MKIKFEIIPAVKQDAHIIHSLIKMFAIYGNVSKEFTGTEAELETALFGEQPYAKVILGYYENKPVGYALYTYNFSTLLCKPGINLIDIFVMTEHRNHGLGMQFLKYLAKLAKIKNFGRIEWAVLRTNIDAIKFYQSIKANSLDNWITYRIEKNNLERLANE